MRPWLAVAGDPGRVHAEGRAARLALEEAREQVAAFFGARPREVLFTSGGTEAVNTAVFGAAARATCAFARAAAGPEEPSVVAAPGRGGASSRRAVEHSAVLEAATGRAGDPGRGRRPRAGRPRGGAGRRAAGDRAGLGPAGQPRGGHDPAGAAVVAGRRPGAGCALHVDACAAAGHVPVDFGALGADLVSVSAHKLGGPGASGPSWSGGACASRRCCWAAPRSGPGGPAWRTWPPPWGSPPRCAELAAAAPRSGSHGRPGRPTGC